MGLVKLTGIEDRPISVSEVTDAVADDRCGAVVTFTGVVRNHDAGRGVSAIDYSAHPSALQTLDQIALGIAERDQVHAVAIVHRVGHVDVGDLAVVAAVAAEHRQEAFRAASDLIDQVKAQVPIWKEQSLTDGSHEWSNLP